MTDHGARHLSIARGQRIPWGGEPVTAGLYCNRLPADYLQHVQCGSQTIAEWALALAALVAGGCSTSLDDAPSWDAAIADRAGSVTDNGPVDGPTDLAWTDIAFPPPGAPVWPLRWHDAHNSSLSPFKGPSAPRQRWLAPRFDELVIAADGTLFATRTQDQTAPYEIAALDPKTGETLRAWPLDGRPAGSLMLGNDGLIRIALVRDDAVTRGAPTPWFGKLSAFDPRGVEHWAHVTPDRGAISLELLGPDDTTYVVGSGVGLTALDPLGRILWTTGKVGYGELCCLSVDGSLIANKRVWLERFDSRTGADLGFIDNPHFVESLGFVSIAPSGTLYLSAGVLNQHDGVQFWFQALDPAGGHSPTTGLYYNLDVPAPIGPDGTVYGQMMPGASHGGDDTHLMAFDPALNLKWTFPVRGSGPVLDADGTAYVVEWGDGRNVIAVDAAGRQRFRLRTDQPLGTPRAIGRDGTIYFVIPGGGIVAIGSSTPPPR